MIHLFILCIDLFSSSTTKRGETLVFSGAGTQITKQKSRCEKQNALGSICAELNRPAGEGIVEGKGSSLLYERADVNGIIHIVAECERPALRAALPLSLSCRLQLTPDADLRLALANCS